jgi:hypothetical protein
MRTNICVRYRCIRFTINDLVGFSGVFWREKGDAALQNNY